MLQQLVVSDRGIEKLHPQELRHDSAHSHLGDRQGRGIDAKMVSGRQIQTPEDILLHRHIFEGGTHHQVRILRILIVRGE